jgi:phage terminase small subunit
LKDLEQKKAIEASSKQDESCIDTAQEKLTSLQEKFCQCLVTDPKRNRTQAAKDAGYSEKTAHVIAAQNLTKLKIVHRIRELELELQSEATMKKKDIVGQYERYAQANILDYLEWDEHKGVVVKPSNLLTRRQAACIAEVKQVTNAKGQRVIQLKLQNQKEALDSLARIEGLFKDTLVHEGEVKTSGVLVVPANMSKKQWLELVKNSQKTK